MAKCVRDGETILRVSDDEAAALVLGGNYFYCPKSVWKEKVRNKKKNEADIS